MGLAINKLKTSGTVAKPKLYLGLFMGFFISRFNFYFIRPQSIINYMYVNAYILFYMHVSVNFTSINAYILMIGWSGLTSRFFVVILINQ